MLQRSAARRATGILALLSVIALVGGCRAKHHPAAAQAQAVVGPAGSYRASCRNSTTEGGRFLSECLQNDGRYRRSSVELSRCKGDIGNQNGLLVCNGAVAQDGGLVAAEDR